MRLSPRPCGRAPAAHPFALRLATALAVTAVLASMPVRLAHADDAEVRTVARVVATSGIDGHLARPVCSSRHAFVDEPFAHLTSTLVAMTSDPDHPFLFDTGGLLSPGGVARFAAGDSPDELAALVEALGYRGLAFGPNELGAPRRAMVEAFRALRARGIPTVATNLFCDPESTAQVLCDQLVDGSDGISIQRSGERRVALIAVIGRAALERVAPDRALGLRLVDEVAAIADGVVRARARGADLIVASVDADAARAIEIATALPEDQRPDVLFAADAGSELVFARPPSLEPAIVAAPPGVRSPFA